MILWSGVLTLSPETDGAKAKNVTGKLVSQQTQRVDVFPTSGLQSVCKCTYEPCTQRTCVGHGHAFHPGEVSTFPAGSRPA